MLFFGCDRTLCICTLCHFVAIIHCVNIYSPFQLLSASTDHNVCIWDVLTGECEQRYRFPTPILRVQFDPRNDRRFLVCPMRHAALLVDTDGEHKILPIDEDVSKFDL